MTTPPPLAIVSKTDAERRALATALERCRQRLFVVGVVHWLGPALAVASLFLTAAIVVLRPSAAAILWWSSAAVVTVTAVTVAGGRRRTPTLAMAAAALDARLSLQDRMSAAWQMSNEHDPVADLVRRDAVRRLADIDIAALYPLGWNRLAACGLLASLVALAGYAAGPTATRTIAQHGADAMFVSTGEAGANAVERPDAPASRRPSSVGSQTPRAGDQSSGATVEARRGDAPPSAAPAGTNPADPTGDAGDVGTSARAQDSPVTRSDRSSSGGATPTAMADARSSSGAGTSGPGGGAGGGATVARATQEGAGGIAGRPGESPVTAVSGATSRTGLARVPVAGGPRGATRGASDDSIPPSRRAYVRDYLDAIASRGQP